MKIRLEIAKASELPSQGRNADSNSAGSATACSEVEIPQPVEAVGLMPLTRGCCYRILPEDAGGWAEFVLYVGRNRDGEFVFQDANGDLLFHHLSDMEATP